ncbi:MAG: acetyl-CoA C-acyltransferase [Balneolaceae bacterium]|nr:acetyl-CoA C-acyltransferase [Balneolaceae bacterium]MBO6544893.1 acetyl-CoA C-acyltransferase [Balneolaceae bacterium]MBO6646289.1 acetyl-CoA C-acyltransferase [Balneolaceae bacterium]
MTKQAYIVSAKRTACGKANKGSLRFTYPDTLGGEVIKDLMKHVPDLDPAEVDDVMMGCAFPEASQGLNIARQIALLGGLPDSVPGVTVNRFCSSGLQTIAMAAERIMAGGADVIIAGGVESMSMVPMGGISFQPNPDLVDNRPEVYISMGLTAENVAEKYKISRDDQDAFAYQSHQRAVSAWEKDKFGGQITPVEVVEKKISAEGELIKETFIFSKDEGPRADTSTEVLNKLRPVFKAGGSVTAGNSSQMNDASAAVLVMSEEKVNELGLTPIARYVGFDVAGVAPEYMGIGPVEAVPKVLDKSGLSLKSIDLIELNEAFASQSLAVIRELGLDQEITNVNGGAIAMGHPLGCTGAKLTTQILHEMKSRGSKYGLVTMCIGGGMGAAGIFENLN